MRSQRWRLRAAVTGAAVLALVAATGPTGSAAPPPAAPPATPSDSATPPTTPGAESPLSATDTALAGATRVTLVTGDVVSYLAAPDGGVPQVEVAAAPRTGGRGVSFTKLREGDAFYVFPSDARALVGAGKLDRSLFDVAYLVQNGYADDRAKSLPVIVQYPKSTGSSESSVSSESSESSVSSAEAKVLSAKADALPGTGAPRALPTVSSTAVTVTKSEATRFWASVDSPTAAGRTSPSASTLDAGVSKIWLDHRTKALLDVSVPQIGAPQAWAAGYDGTGVKVAILDTGIDETHPDLAGKVIASKSFIEGETVRDGHGHGTHIASTIVGSGAASGGKYKGVAPGAELLIGKVMNDGGTGADSEIIAGMQWAAESGAKIVSISIGGTYSDGTDPMSQTVNELSARYGTLFVIAAGNSGPGSQQVEAPGVAEAALTVAAVDKQDQMADFSSRGPRRGDLGMKPDIAAPGAGITAAKADGTALGPVVDEKYTTISGTSMATPHVAGSAAILLQEHPDWTGQKLKAVLTSTSKDVGHGTYEQGAGRVDVPRAITQQVYAAGSVNFGKVAFPHTAPATRTLTYTNDGDAPVTLDLTTSLTARTGTPPAGMLTVTPSTVTVPAHGTADVDVVFDVTKGGADTSYGGAVHASGDGVTVNTAVGGFKQARQAKVTLNVIDRPEATDISYFGYWALRLDDQPGEGFLALSPGVQSQTSSLDAGFYSFGTDVTWRDANGEFNHALVTNPTVDLTKDEVTVTFDLRRAQPVVASTPKPSVPYRLLLGYLHTTEKNKSRLEQSFDQPYGSTLLWSAPTGKATRGEFTSYSEFVNGIDPVKMTLLGRGKGGGGTALHPYYEGIQRNSIDGHKVTMLDGRQTLPLVYAGAGRPADFQGVDARGKIVLLDLSDLCPVEPPTEWGFPCTTDGLDRVENAQSAGAVAVLGYGSVGRSFLSPMGRQASYNIWTTYPIPTMNLTANEGQMLARRLATSPVSIDVDAHAITPYLYPLVFVQHDQMPAGKQKVTERNLRTVTNRLHADAAGAAGISFRPLLPGPVLLQSYSVAMPAPATLTAYVGPVSTDVAWNSAAALRYTAGNTPGWSQSIIDVFDRAGAQTRDWGEQPLVPNIDDTDPATADYGWQFCMSCRNGNMFSTRRALNNTGSQGGYVSYARGADGNPTTTLHLYSDDGTEIPMTEGLWNYFISFFRVPYFTLPEEPARYRLTEDFVTPLASQVYAREVQTERTFTSQRRDDGLTTVPPPGVGIHCDGWLVRPALGDNTWGNARQDPCQPTDELYLGLDFDLDLDNTLPADSRHSVKITALHSPYLADPATVRSVRLSLSFDDGRTWTKIRTTRARDGSFSATFDHPALSRTTGAVSVRAEATDSAGNTIKETIHRAYGLKDRPRGGHGGHGGHHGAGATAI